jgi:hypothetical protein
MTDQTNEKLVLALDVHPQSFGFVVFEGPNQILDWGVRSFRTGVNAVKIPAATRFLALLDEFRPSAVVIGERLARKTAKQAKIPVRCISRGDVNRAFVGFESNKYEVASALAQQFPDLAVRLPPRRKCWQSEDYRMGIFDAAALGVAYFVRREKRLPTTSVEDSARAQ